MQYQEQDGRRPSDASRDRAAARVPLPLPMEIEIQAKAPVNIGPDLPSPQRETKKSRPYLDGHIRIPCIPVPVAVVTLALLAVAAAAPQRWPNIFPVLRNLLAQ